MGEEALSALIAAALEGTRNYIEFEFSEAIQLIWHRLVTDLSPEVPTYREVCRSPKWAGLYETYLKPMCIAGRDGILRVDADALFAAAEHYAATAVDGCLNRLEAKFGDLEIMGVRDVGMGRIAIDAILMRKATWVEIEQRTAVTVGKDDRVTCAFPRRILVDGRIQTDFQYRSWLTAK